MKFMWSTLTIKDMEESLKFYQEIVGLNIERRFKPTPEMELAFLGDGETKVELICNKEVKEFKFGENISLGFQVDSAEEMMTFVKEKGIKIHSGPFQPNEHTKYFFVLDPNGLKIQFVEIK